MTSRAFDVVIEVDGALSFIRVPFDPKPVFGKVRAPVAVTLNGYTYRSTISIMHGVVGVPLRASHRAAAGVEAGQSVRVTLSLDDAPRTVAVPDDLRVRLDAVAALRRAWDQMSYTHQREYVEAIEAAKKPETRARRVAATIEALEKRAQKR